jgi:ankyrin repeat protein
LIDLKKATMAAESDVDRVYRAVVAQEDEDKVRLLIEEFAQGSDKRRAALVNMPVKRAGDGKEETPLQAIVRIDPKSKLIPVLLEAGADVKAVYGGRVTALGLCDAADGGVDSFRKLLRAGHDPSERFLCEWHRDDPTPGGFATVLHQCAVQGKLEHVEFLVREGGMDIDLRGWQGLTPLHVFVLYCKVLDPTPALDLFASLGADFNARDSEGKTPIVAVPHNTAAMTSKLLARGASADVTDYQNRTPLMHACGQRVHNNPRRPDTINELLRCSSNETRRVASEAASTKGHSAIDALFFCDKDQQFEPWHLHVVSSLVDSGASVLPGHVDGLEAKLRELAAGEQSADWIKERVEVVCKQLQAFKVRGMGSRALVALAKKNKNATARPKNKNLCLTPAPPSHPPAHPTAGGHNSSPLSPSDPRAHARARDQDDDGG